MKSNHHSQQIVKSVCEQLKAKLSPERFDAVWGFLVGYGEYIELQDDLVDEPKDLERFQRAQALGAKVFSSLYWQANLRELYLVEQLINLTYYDSERMRQSNDEWLKREGQCLSHAGYNMLFAVIILELGFEAAMKISFKFRLGAHLLHKNDSL